MEYQPIHALFYNVFQVLKVYTSYKTYTIRYNAQFIYLLFYLSFYISI